MKLKNSFFSFSRRGFALESNPESIVQPNLKPIFELIIRQEGQSERRVRPRKSKKVILFGSGVNPNFPESEFIEVDHPSVNPTHCLLKFNSRFGWRVEIIEWKGIDLAPKNESWSSKPRKVVEGSTFQVGEVSVLPVFKK
jgi:hypothetical protein